MLLDSLMGIARLRQTVDRYIREYATVAAAYEEELDKLENLNKELTALN